MGFFAQFLPLNLHYLEGSPVVPVLEGPRVPCLVYPFNIVAGLEFEEEIINVPGLSLGRVQLECRAWIANTSIYHLLRLCWS